MKLYINELDGIQNYAFVILYKSLSLPLIDVYN